MKLSRHLLLALAAVAILFLPACAGSRSAGGVSGPGVRQALLPPGVHGRYTNRTMSPSYITVHATENPGATAANHAAYLSRKGKRSRHNPRSAWVVWHYTVDDREAVQHLLPTEQGDHADYGGRGDRTSIGIEICQFRDGRRQAAAIDRAARLAASLAHRYGIPQSHIVPHLHWPRWDFRYGKPCPRILLERDPRTPGGWKTGRRWDAFLRKVQSYR
jgi:N-acetylmuramoyl-L-alanine amidase